MLDSLNQIIEQVIDFCREHNEVLMIGGAALVILIVLIAVIKSILKKDSDEDLDFDESAYFDAMINAKAKKESEEAVSAAEVKMDPLMEKCKQQVIFPEELIEELSKISANNLQEVEIKIQSAELRLRYAGAKAEDSQIHEEIKVFGEKHSEQADEDVCSGETVDNKDDKKELQVEITKEDLKQIPVEAPAKFGPGNYNTSRSGRVFTEEELEKQIRD